MFSRILVAVDGSESSLRALRESLRLARAEKGLVIAVSVIPPNDGELPLVGVRNVAATLRGPYERALAESENIARAEGVRVYPVLDEGEPHERIADLAESEGCTLIVVGVRGFNPAEKVVMGSMTARIIGCSRTDILVIPRESPLGWDNLLIAVDGSESGRRALHTAAYFQSSYGSEVTLVSVADVPSHLYGIDASAAEGFIGDARKALEEASREAESAGIRAESLLREGDPAEVITDLADKRHAELILMGSHGRTGLKRLLMGSVTEKVIGRSLCPVFVARADARPH